MIGVGEWGTDVLMAGGVEGGVMAKIWDKAVAGRDLSGS